MAALVREVTLRSPDKLETCSSADLGPLITNSMGIEHYGFPWEGVSIIINHHTALHGDAQS